MPRSRRQFAPDSVLHVVNRGNDRRTLFHNPAEYEEFRWLMRHAQGRVPLRLVAYVLMPNHWHFVVWPECSTQLSRYLHLVASAHAARWRRRSGRSGEGHVYQDRYHAFVVESERQYLSVLRYVEANPFRAGLVASAADWTWSSLAERRSGNSALLSPGPVPLPECWPATVEQSVSPDVLADIRERSQRAQRAAWQPARHQTP